MVPLAQFRAEGLEILTMTQPSSPIANSRELTLPQDATSWVEVSQSAIAHNIKQLNHAGASSGGQPKLCVMV